MNWQKRIKRPVRRVLKTVDTNGEIKQGSVRRLKGDESTAINVCKQSYKSA